MSERKRRTSEVKEQFWRQQVEAWQKSEKSVRAYCVEAALSVPSFYAWRRELARRDGVEPPHAKRWRGETQASTPGAGRCGIGRSSWIQLQVSSVAAASAPIEIELAGGTVVRLRGEVNRQALFDVLAALTSASSVEPEARPC
jgi:hypothetical protein